MSVLELLARNWWAVAVRGLVAILFGVLLLAWPGPSLMVLVIAFGAFALLDGLFSIVAAVRAARGHENWGSLLLVGITGILAALVTWFWPGITALAFAFVIGAWAIVSGILAIVAAVELRRELKGEFWLGLSGALAILFGVLVFANPAAGALAIVVLLSTFAILYGVSLLVLAYRMRSLSHRREVPV